MKEIAIKYSDLALIYPVHLNPNVRDTVNQILSGIDNVKLIDPWFIVSEFPEQAKIIRSAREINNYKTEWVIEKVKSTTLQFELDHGRKPKIACMGLAFKPNIDDLRESPALHVAISLSNQGFDIVAVEPNIDRHDQLYIGGI